MTQPWVDPALLQLEASHTGTPHEDDATRAAWAELLAGSKPQVGASARNKAASKLARKQAMPQATRGALWLRLSGGEHLLQQRPRMYQEAEAGRRGLRLSDVDIRAPPPQHEAVTLPTFGSPVDPRGLCLTREGLQRAVRVLQCLKYEHSEALYCPFLPTVVVAALHWMDEEQAFAMATGLLHQPCPMVVTRLQTWQRLIAMDRLAMTINPKAYKQLCEYLGVPFAPSIGHNHPLTGAEQLWVSHHLPFWALMRFLDNFIAEGDKTFFRFGLAILQCWYMACPHVVHHGRSKEALSVPPPSLPTDLPVPIRGVSATSSSGAPPGTDSGPSSRSNTASAANTPGASRTSSRKSSMVPATGLSAASGSGDEADLGSSPRRMGGMLAATKAVAVAFMSAFSPSSSSDRRPSNSQTNAGRRNSNSSSNHGAEPDAAPTTAALLKSGGGQRPAPLQLPAHPLPAKGMSKSESPTRRRLSAGVSSSLSPELSPPEPLTPTALDDSGPATVRTTRSVRFTLGSSQDEDVLPPPRDRADSLLSYASDDSNLVMDDTTDGEDTPLARTTASLAKLAMSSNSLTRLERESLRRGNSSDLSSSGEELLHGRRRAHSGGEVKLVSLGQRKM